MKKTFLLITSVCALVLIIGATPVSAQGRIATVDLKKLFDGYWKTKQADAALKDRGADLEKEFKAMMDEYTKGKDAYNTLKAASNDPAISDSEKERKKKEAEDKLRGLKDQEEAMTKFQNQARATVDEQRRRMRDNILGEVRKAVDGKAKLGGYSMVIDIAAETISNTPVVLYTAGENDITDAVLSQLNASAPPEAQLKNTSGTTSTNK